MTLACLVLALAPMGDTLLVDFHGPNGLPSVQAAVNAAANGDTIIIREPASNMPTRPGFVIDGKALTILVVEPAPSVERVHLGKCVIRNVPLGETVKLHGIAFVPNSYSSPISGLEVTQCAGAVRVESCTFETPTYWDLSQPPSLDLESAYDVSLVNCSMDGNVQGGVRASRSRVALYRCDLTGRVGRGSASYTHAVAGPGYPAIELLNRSFAWVGDSVVQGGQGGGAECIHGADCITNSGDGGIGLYIEAGSHGVLLDSDVIGGEAGWSWGTAAGSSTGVPGVDVFGTPVHVPGGQRYLDAPVSVDSGESVDLSVEGLPGETAMLFIGTEGGHRYLGPLHGALLVNGGLQGAPIDLGVIPANGVLEASVQLPLAPVEGADTYLFQAFCRTSPSRYRMTSPRQVTVLGENTPLLRAPSVLYVDASAVPGGQGRSWQYAASNLHDAVEFLPRGGEPRTAVWIAAGWYTPAPSGEPSSQASIRGRRGISFLGGFLGNELDPSERPVLSHSTISGDLLGDDQLLGGTRDDNSYGILSFAAADQEPRRISGIHFIGATGVAVGANAMDIEFDRCTFTSNRGAVDLFNVGPFDHHTTFRSCRFVDNRGSYGGAISCRASSQGQLGTRVLIHNCEFIGNSATERQWINPSLQVKLGGAFYNTSPNTVCEITNCSFLDNEDAPSSTTEQIGFCGIYSAGPVTFRNNACANLLSESGVHPVFWTLDSGQGHVTEFSASAWSGAGWGPSNVVASPDFVDLLGPDGIRATGDEDLRLRSGSPCVDAGHSFVLPTAIQCDLGGEPRYTDDLSAPNVGVGGTRIIDMGAYERR